jgi:hypothetical protein
MESAMQDINQTRLMTKMAGMIEFAMQGQSPDYKKEVRGVRKDFFCTLPVRRVWIFLKSGGRRNLSKDGPVAGPEDVIVDGKGSR